MANLEKASTDDTLRLEHLQCAFAGPYLSKKCLGDKSFGGKAAMTEA